MRFKLVWERILVDRRPGTEDRSFVFTWKNIMFRSGQETEDR